MKTLRLRPVLFLLLTALLFAATALRFGHHISKSNFLLCYGVALMLGIVVRCLPEKPLIKRGF
jgi:hypothetical protein